MAYDKYEDRLTTIKNHEAIEKLICETLDYDPKKTKFFREGKYDVKDCVMMHNAIDKLGKIEDKEEELEIELLDLIAAVENGIYSKEWDEIRPVQLIYTDPTHNFKETDYDKTYEGLCLYDDAFGQYYYFKDYGKIWALTKEELEQ